jgi:membrane protein YdbS with pleckstrin-like domain
VPAAAYRHYAYQVGEVDVRVMHGWLTRTVAVVLHSRIQHVDTRQGPVERAMGLATVVIFTAGSVGAMVAIPGIAQAEAEALRDRLAHLSGAEDAV